MNKAASPTSDGARHGRDCPKVKHIGGGYLHREDHDLPYDVDGVMYCGRCHGWMETAPKLPKSDPVGGNEPLCENCGQHRHAHSDSDYCLHYSGELIAPKWKIGATFTPNVEPVAQLEEMPRCQHGVWAADHCEQCAGLANNALGQVIPAVDGATDRPYCPACNSVGLSHCAHPNECGNVIYPEKYVMGLESKLSAARKLAEGQIRKLATCYICDGCDYASETPEGINHNPLPDGSPCPVGLILGDGK